MHFYYHHDNFNIVVFFEIHNVLRSRKYDDDEFFMFARGHT